MAEKHKLVLYVTDEQEEALQIFWGMNDWDFMPETESDTRDSSTMTNTLSSCSEDSEVNASPMDMCPKVSETSDISNFEEQGETCVSETFRLREIDIITDKDGRTPLRCRHCFLSPCITTQKQQWLGKGQSARAGNAAIRRQRYKLFWKLLNDNGAWQIQEYIQKKVLAMNRNNPAVVWTTREIIPDCVLGLVRDLYPNPLGNPYMGHQWS